MKSVIFEADVEFLRGLLVTHIAKENREDAQARRLLARLNENIEANPEVAQKYRGQAKEEFEIEGEIEIDEDCAVSVGDAGHAYVQAWVHVYMPEGE